MDNLPILYLRKETCCGCAACCALCPSGAISMVEDDDGFEYPHIDAGKCVRCYLCTSICDPYRSVTR